MRTPPSRITSLLAASTLVLPLMLMGCNRADNSPTASTPSKERQAMTPSSPDRMLESAPPAAGTPPSGTTAPPSSTSPSGSESSSPSPSSPQGSTR